MFSVTFKKEVNIIFLLIFIIINVLITFSFKKQLAKGVGDKKNLFMGYRTIRSLKSESSWEFAQNAFIKNSEMLSRILILVGFIWSIFDIFSWLEPASLYAQLIVFFIYIFTMIFMTEKKVKNYERKQQK